MLPASAASRVRGCDVCVFLLVGKRDSFLCISSWASLLRASSYFTTDATVTQLAQIKSAVYSGTPPPLPRVESPC
jgi:hypothetical protein